MFTHCLPIVMATLKYTIKKDKMRADKTWNVLIRLTHDRKIRYISTTMYVTKKDMTASFKIKNQQIIDKCNELIKAYRDKLAPLNLELNDIPIDDVVEYLKTNKEKTSSIDFIVFARKWIEQHPALKGAKNYNAAINALCLFFGREHILCSEITVKSMKAFEESLSDKPRAQSLYTSSIVRLFNEAKDYYNDEDNNVIRIKNSLNKYKPAKQNVAEKRSLTTEQIRAIFALPYSGVLVKGKQCRRDLALECFKLSFCLLGMNSVDLYNATEYDGEYITYCRAKTKDRRNDQAKMVVHVHPIIKPLVEKYRGKERVFNFYERFSSMADLNRSINIGLKEIGKEIGVDDLQFYAARHTMATIAANEAGIDRWTVNLMLNHTDQSMRVTELYIKRDFSPINEANDKLMKYVFPEIME